MNIVQKKEYFNYQLQNNVVWGSVGGLMDSTTPLICGGRNPGTNQCYKLESGAWQPMPAMIQIRYHFAGMSFSPFHNLTHKFFVLGS